MMIPVAVVGRLTASDLHLLGCKAIVAGPESTWTAPRFGVTARVYREGFHLLEGVAVIAGSSPEEMAFQVAGCPYPVILVAFWGSAKGKGYRALESAVAARQKMGQVVHLFAVTPTFGSWMEAGDGCCAFTGGYPEPTTKAEPTTAGKEK